MSPFILDIPTHAEERLKLRKITRFHVRKTIALGELIQVNENGRNIRRLKIGAKLLEVVYLSKPGGFILVTAYYVGNFP